MCSMTHIRQQAVSTASTHSLMLNPVCNVFFAEAPSLLEPNTSVWYHLQTLQRGCQAALEMLQHDQAAVESQHKEAVESRSDHAL